MPDQPRRIRISIADDHQIFRDGLRRLLESEPGFEVVSEGADGLDAIRMARDSQPDILLLDVAMPRMGGVEALASLANVGPRVILLTAAIQPSDLLKAIQFGARGVVMKESATRLLIDGIHRVMDGKYIIGADVANIGAYLFDLLVGLLHGPAGAHDVGEVVALLQGALELQQWVVVWHVDRDSFAVCACSWTDPRRTIAVFFHDMLLR